MKQKNNETVQLERMQRLIKPVHVDRCWKEIEKVVAQYGLQLVDDSMTTGGFYITQPKYIYPDGWVPGGGDAQQGLDNQEYKQFCSYCGADFGTVTSNLNEVDGYEFMVWGKITKKERNCLIAITGIIEKRYGIEISIDIF